MYTYKFRIYPKTEIVELLIKWFGCSRYVWNLGLDRKTQYYKNTGKSLSYLQLAKELTLLKRDQTCLKEAPSQPLFARFFERKSAYPKFKSKKNLTQSLQIPQGFKIKGNKLYLPKLRKTPIRIKKHREIKVNIKRIIISMNKIGHFVSIVTDYTPQKLPKSNKKIGIDLGLKHFLITSDGRKIPLSKMNCLQK